VARDEHVQRTRRALNTFKLITRVDQQRRQVSAHRV
jgi:hypothetical protein